MDQVRRRLEILDKSLISIRKNLAKLVGSLPINVLEPKLSRIEWHLAQIQGEIDIDALKLQGNVNGLIQECLEKRAIVLLERLPWSNQIEIDSVNRSDYHVSDCVEAEIESDYEQNELEKDPLADPPMDTNELSNPVTSRPDSEASSQAPPKKKSRPTLRKIAKPTLKIKHLHLEKVLKLPPQIQQLSQIAKDLNSQDPDYFKCPYEGCSKKTQNSNLVAIEFHKMTHAIPSLLEDEKRLYCSICEITLTDPRATRYRIHILNHYGIDTRKLTCSFPGCDKKFRDISEKKGHEKTHTNPEPRRRKQKTPQHLLNECPKCPRTFVSFESYAKHVQAHDTFIICEYCGKEFCQLDLNEHVAETHKRKCKVDGCMLEFPTAKDLKEHWESSHLPQFQCDQCPESFYNREMFQRHTVKVHVGLFCSFEGCGKKLSRRDKLITHERAHQREIEAQDRLKRSGAATYACPLCGKLYSNQASLAYHKTCVHEESYNFKCRWPGCGKKFKTEGRLKMHVVYHQEERSVCEYCQKDFPSEKAMTEHAGKEHRKELDLPFKCPIGGCGMSYAKHRFLDLHLEKVHI